MPANNTRGPSSATIRLNVETMPMFSGAKCFYHDSPMLALYEDDAIFFIFFLPFAIA